MNSEWQTFLEAQSAVIDQGKVQHFGAPEAERRAALEGDVIADLSHFGLIQAHGTDASRFLQGQLSNDVRQLDSQRSHLTAYCTPKGRMLAIMRLFQTDGVYYLRLPRELLEPVLKRLRMYILRMQVALEDVSNTFAQVGVTGERALSLLRKALGVLPEATDAVLRLDAYGGLNVLQIPGPRPRFILIGSPPGLEALWRELSRQITPIGSGPWELLDIRAGLPTLYSATVDAFIPQWLNLEMIGGVSFEKGCYPGQEVIARTQHLGTPKRRMYRASVQDDQSPHPGDLLYTAEGTQSVGQVVEAQAHPDTGFELLVVVQITQKDSRLHLHTPEGPLLQLAELPYTAVS